MRSDAMKKGLEKAPHRSLFKAMGYTDAELDRPIIGVANSANEIIPGTFISIRLPKRSRPVFAWRAALLSNFPPSGFATASP